MDAGGEETYRGAGRSRSETFREPIMNGRFTLIAGAIVLVVAIVAAGLFSGRGTPEPTETAPAALPVPTPGGEPPPPTVSPAMPPGRTLSDEPAQPPAR
jgi:hypothetical protein